MLTVATSLDGRVGDELCGPSRVTRQAHQTRRRRPPLAGQEGRVKLIDPASSARCVLAEVLGNHGWRCSP